MAILLLLALLQAAPETQPARVEAYVEAFREADAALVAGEFAEAAVGFQQALELSPGHPNAAYGLACAASRSGRTDVALDWLERAVEWGWLEPAVAEWDPDLEPIRGDGRFAALLEGMRGALDARAGAGGTAMPTERWLLGGGSGGGAQIAELTPGGARVVAGLGDGRLLLLDGGTGALERELVRLEQVPWGLAVSSDGKGLAVLGYDGRLALLLLDGSPPADPVDALPPSQYQHPFGRHLAWSRDGGTLLLVHRDGEAALVSSASEVLARWKLEGSEADRRARWMPDGQRLVTAEGATIQLRDGRTAEVLTEPVTCPAPVVALALSPDGERLAAALVDAWVVVWDLQAGVELGRRRFVDPLFPDEDDDVPELAFSPDGTQLAWSSREGSHVEVVESESMELVWRSEFLGAHFFEALRLTWSPREPRLWYAFECGGGSLTMASSEGSRSGRFTGDAVELTLGTGAVPDFSGGRGALPLVGGVSAVDPRTGRMLWRRIEVPGGALIQAPSGHFAGTWTSLEGLFITRPLLKEPYGLDPARVERLFDPKRVRAAQAGVSIALAGP